MENVMIGFLIQATKKSYELYLDNMESCNDPETLFRPTYSQLINIITDLGDQIISMTKDISDISLLCKINDAWGVISDILISAWSKETVLVTDVIKQLREVEKELTI